MNYVQEIMIRNLMNDFQMRNPSVIDDALKNRMMTFIKQNPEKYQDFSKDIYDTMISGNVDSFFGKYGFKEQEITEEKVEEEMKKDLNLEDVSQFNKDGQNFTKLQTGDTVQVIENLEDKTLKEEFEERLQNPTYVSEDGKTNTQDIFNDMRKEKIESNLQNVTDINKDQLNNEQLAQVNVLQSANKEADKTFVDVENGMSFTFNPNVEQPKSMGVTEKDGMYVVNQMGEETHQTNVVEQPIQNNMIGEPQLSGQEIQTKLVEMASNIPHQYAEEAKEIMMASSVEEMNKRYQEFKKKIESKEPVLENVPELEGAKVKKLVPDYAEKGSINFPTYLLFVTASASAFFYLSLLYLKVLP